MTAALDNARLPEMASSVREETVAGRRSIWPPVVLVLSLLGLAILVPFLSNASRSSWADVLAVLSVAVIVLTWNAVLVWAVTHRAWATPTHLVVKNFGRVEAIRWEDIRSVTYIYQSRLPGWLMIRTGYGAGGRTLCIGHELFRNPDQLHAEIAARARRAAPVADISAFEPAYAQRRATRAGSPLPLDLEQFEPVAANRDASIRLMLTWRARLGSSAGIALATIGLVHVGVSVPQWLSQGSGPSAGGFALLVAELSIGPLIGAMSLYVLSSTVLVTPDGVTIRAWGQSERAIRWEEMLPPRWPGLRSWWVLAPKREVAVSAFAALFDARAVVVPFGSYQNDGVLLDPPGVGGDAAITVAGRATRL